jgi:hypothetical protein
MTENTTNTQETAIQARKEMEDIALLPDTMRGAMALARTLAQSRLIPTPLQGKPADVLVILMTGKELGLKPMQALRSVYVVEGKPSLSSELAAAMVHKSGKADFFDLVNSTSKSATYRTRRKGSETISEITFGVEDATAAGYMGKANYKTNPAAMFRARAALALARAVYPDVTVGIIDEDEADDIRARAGASIETAPARPKSLDELTQRLNPQMEIQEGSKSETVEHVDQQTGEITEVQQQQGSSLPMAAPWEDMAPAREPVPVKRENQAAEQLQAPPANGRKRVNPFGGAR